MDTTNMTDIPSVRLASGIEMQQRWPSALNNDQQQSQKEGEAPRLIELTPTKGIQGTVVTVVVQSLPHPMVPVKLAFNSLVVDTKQMQAQGITSLAATVPPFQHTHSASVNVPISICMIDKDTVTETWPVAEFVYEFEPKDSTITTTTSATTPPLSTAPTTASTATSNDDSAFQLTSKVENITSTYPQKEENLLGGTTAGTTATSYNNFYEQPVNDFNNQSYNYSYNRDIFNDNKFNSYNPNNETARTNNQQPSLNPLNYNSSTSTFNLFNSSNAGFTNILAGFDQNDSQMLPAPITQSTPVTYSPIIHQEPPQQRSSAPVTPSIYSYNKSYSLPSTSVANYQPYPGLISRANLKIMGDLDSMAKSWTNEEWEHRRRLVQFWREQNGNEIRCTFEPVAQGDRISTNNGNIIISCIYWAERNDCFITSVDCIHLLESLMDIRFSVEEKNRVRRNLEGFRPLTVSKCKPDSAEFFKLIMSFPNPKPRNIEKDVKVFPWKTLPYALKKIVTKYTASSYNAISHTQQQRRTQLKNALLTPNPTPPATNPALSATSYLGQQTMLNPQDASPYSFYSQQQQQQPSPYVSYAPSTTAPSTAANTPSEQQQHNSVATILNEPTTSIYQSSSIPAFSSSAYDTAANPYSLQPLQPQPQEEQYILSPQHGHSAPYAPTSSIASQQPQMDNSNIITNSTTPSPGNI